jgi:cell wall-associated NlpC family hydrolase
LKRKIAIAGAVAVLLGCSSATVADEKETPIIIKYKSSFAPKTINSVLKISEYMTMIEKQIEDARKQQMAESIKREALFRNKKAIDDQITNISKYVDKTWYVFSGSTPRGWDCSGLVVWFYSEIGIELPHSATKQGLLKPKVKNPKPGDVVVFRYKKSKTFIHSGIYIGDNNIIHAGFKKGDRTEVISLDSPAFKNQDIFFIRVIEH